MKDVQRRAVYFALLALATLIPLAALLAAPVLGISSAPQISRAVAVDTGEGPQPYSAQCRFAWPRD